MAKFKHIICRALKFYGFVPNQNIVQAIFCTFVKWSFTCSLKIDVAVYVMLNLTDQNIMHTLALIVLYLMSLLGNIQKH